MIPLISRARESIRVLCFSNNTEREFTQEEIALAEQLASGAASAVENGRLFEEVQQKSREREVLVNLNRDIASLLDRETLLRHIAEEARRLLNFDGANFRLIEGEHLNLVSSSHPKEVNFRSRLRLGESLSDKVIQGNRAVAVRDVLADSTIVEEHREMLRKGGYHASGVFPCRHVTRWNDQGAVFLVSTPIAVTRLPSSIF